MGLWLILNSFSYEGSLIQSKNDSLDKLTPDKLGLNRSACQIPLPTLSKTISG